MSEKKSCIEINSEEVIGGFNIFSSMLVQYLLREDNLISLLSCLCAYASMKI